MSSRDPGFPGGRPSMAKSEGLPTYEAPLSPRHGWDAHESAQPDAAIDGSGQNVAPGPRRPIGGIGLWWWSLILIFALGALALGSIWAAREISMRGYFNELEATFSDVSLSVNPALNIPDSDRQLQMYFVVRGQVLTPQSRKLRQGRDGATIRSIERIELVAQELQKPLQSSLLKSPLPEGAVIRGVYLLDGYVWLDVSQPFTDPENPTPMGERLAVYGIVNSFLLNDPSLQGVRFLVEGQPVDSAWGWLDLSSPLGPDLSLVRGR